MENTQSMVTTRMVQNQTVKHHKLECINDSVTWVFIVTTAIIHDVPVLYQVLYIVLDTIMLNYFSHYQTSEVDTNMSISQIRKLVINRLSKLRKECNYLRGESELMSARFKNPCSQMLHYTVSQYFY